MRDQLDALYSGLLSALLKDLEDPEKNTPGLYTVIRGIINDNKDKMSRIPDEETAAMENKLSDAIPFKQARMK